MQKLIKLSDTHYIIVDDSEIEEGDLVLNPLNEIQTYFKDYNFVESKKITHSTQPLEGVKLLSLSKVEEAIYGYGVEKMVKDAYIKHSVKDDRLSLDEQIQRSGGFNVGYKEGFKAHQELVKDKLFTVEDMKKAFEAGIRCTDWIDGRENFIHHFLPKTEWDVKFDEKGKISLAP